MLEMLSGYTPKDLGFGDEFESYRVDPSSGREVQLEAIEYGVTCDKRFCAMSIPTGIGKSLIAVSIAKITGLRTVILTATKALQEQYSSAFKKYGLVDIKGRSNYQCNNNPELDCRDGGVVGCNCCNGHGCAYEVMRDRARNSNLVSANYAFWMNVNDHAGGLERTEREKLWKGENPVECLILDEGHVADVWLEGYLSTKIYEKEIKRWCDGKLIGDNIDQWKDISSMAMGDLEAEIEIAKQGLLVKGHRSSKLEVNELHNLERLYQKFERINGIKDDWIIEKFEGTRYGRLWSFDVIWPGRYSEQYLFCNVPKVIVMSATLRPKTMGLLGVKKEDFNFNEWPRVFAANRNPIYNIPAKNVDGKDIRIDRRIKNEDLITWVDHIDGIIAGRLDRKGLIQTVSYDRAKYLIDNSKYSEYMCGNTSDPESDTAVQVAETFRNSKPPKILVSPSFSMGWDFEGESCEYVIVCKIPFKNSNSKVQKERELRDPKYSSYMAMQELIQSSGRAMRSFEDRSEIFLTDGHVNWFLYQNKSLGSAWFINAVRKVNQIPKAPIRLADEKKIR
jgi:ATP-dependent DNA helicase DinG